MKKKIILHMSGSNDLALLKAKHGGYYLHGNIRGTTHQSDAQWYSLRRQEAKSASCRCRANSMMGNRRTISPRPMSMSVRFGPNTQKEA